jgi:hypothetical protein
VDIGSRELRGQSADSRQQRHRSIGRRATAARTRLGLSGSDAHRAGGDRQNLACHASGACRSR